MTEVTYLSLCTESVSLSCQGESVKACKCARRALLEIPALIGSRPELQDGGWTEAELKPEGKDCDMGPVGLAKLTVLCSQKRSNATQALFYFCSYWVI